MTDHWANYSDHTNSGIYRTGIQIETNDEELYRKNRQVLLELIDEIKKEEIPPDLKTRMIDFLIDVSKNPTVADLFIAYVASHFH